jgi:hypothetical protein
MSIPKSLSSIFIPSIAMLFFLFYAAAGMVTNLSSLVMVASSWGIIKLEILIVLTYLNPNEINNNTKYNSSESKIPSLILVYPIIIP